MVGCGFYKSVPSRLVAKSWQTNLYPWQAAEKWQLGKENVPRG